MDLFRSGIKSMLGHSEPAGQMSGAETVERLVERLRSASLLEDRRDACRALRSLSKKYRIEVGAQCMSELIAVLTGEVNDAELVGYALDTLCNVTAQCVLDECDGGESSDECAADDSGDDQLGEQFTEIFIKTAANVHAVLELLAHYEFRIRFPAVRLVCNLLQNRAREMQEIVILTAQAVPRMMDLLNDSREVIRNDALIMLTHLTKGNANIQKIVAFENAFDRLFDVIAEEEAASGGIIVEDCLILMLNLLRNNASNQSLFREGNYTQRLSACFVPLTADSAESSDAEDAALIGWSAQKVSNVHYMLQLVRTLAAPTNPRQDTSAAQRSMQACGLLAQLCRLLMAAGVPADILAETIAAVGEVCRGCGDNQRHLAGVTAPTVPPRPALLLLLMSLVNDKQPLSLRCAVLYCVQCYLWRNPEGQSLLVHTLLPEQAASTTEEATEPAADDVTSGRLLCSGLFSSEPLSVWLSAVALSHALAPPSSPAGQQQRVQLLRVQLATGSASGNAAGGALTLMQQILSCLQQTGAVTSRSHSRLGLLLLLATWLAASTPAVNQLLQLPAAVPYLVSQLVSNESDDRELLCQSVCAFIVGECVLATDSSVEGYSRHQLLQLVERRVGVETYLNKLAHISRHELYSRCLKHPQLSARERYEVALDHEFCRLFKAMEPAVVKCVTMEEGEAEVMANSGAVVSAIVTPPGGSSENDESQMVARYKQLIRQQDDQLTRLQQSEQKASQQLQVKTEQVDELTASLTQLRDQITLLRAQQGGGEGVKQQVPNQAGGGTEDNPTTAATTQQISQQLDYKHSLELAALRQAYEQQLATLVDDNTRLTEQLTALNDQHALADTASANTSDSAELQTLRNQVAQLEQKLAESVADCGQLKLIAAEKHQLQDQLQQVQAEQEDLLVLLTDQDARIERYKSRLKQLNVCIDDDD